MTDDDSVFSYDGIEIGEDMHVVGSAIADVPGYEGYTVSASVTSYKYGDGGEQMNHVPHVVISDADGSVVAEPHAHDSSRPEEAIEEALALARDVVDDPARYL